ncbi:MAG: META domain-containing protein [Halomonas sp.]|nr:META domain-containing protein [Halomonas sp.]
MYLERIAMPPETRAIVELKAFTPDGFGSIASMEETFDGRQIPIPFELEAASFTGSPAVFELKAGLELDGRIIRASEPVTVFPSSTPVDVGELLLRPFDVRDYGTAMDCGGTEVVFDTIGEHLVMQVGAEDFTLRRVPAASGVRYESTGDPSASLFNKGARADVTVRGETLPECTIDMTPTDPVHATGNEPPWIASIEGDQLTLITEYGATTRTAPVVNAHRGVSVTRYRAAGDELAVSLNIRSEVCNDSMTGMPHPYSASLASPQGVLHGCAGQPSDLLAKHAWKVTMLDGQAPLSEPSMTIQFLPEDGIVAGSSSCNRFNAPYTLTGERLELSNIAGTMMLCSEEIMAQEQEFKRVLSGIEGFDIDADGMLELRGSEGQLLARPTTTDD